MSEPILSGDVHIGQHNDKLKQLLAYCERDWRVFPIWEIDADGHCACRGPCDRNAGKHPIGYMVPNGHKDASSDPEQIIRWHEQRPTANWGWALVDHFVLDLDPRNGFPLEDLNNWEAIFGFPLPVTLIQWTGGGGCHIIFAADGHDVRNGKLHRTYSHDGKTWRSKVKGVDVKGVGGYILVAPSNHKSGGLYALDDASRMPAGPSVDLLGMLKRGSGSSVEGDGAEGVWKGDGEREWTPDRLETWLAGDVPPGEQFDELTSFLGWARNVMHKDQAMVLVWASAQRWAQGVDEHGNLLPAWTQEELWKHVNGFYENTSGRSEVELAPEQERWLENFSAKTTSRSGDASDDVEQADVERPSEGALREFKRLLDRDEGTRLYAAYVRERHAPEDEADNRVVTGGAIFDEPDQVPAYWGRDGRILGARGQGTMIVGHQGVGKTTLAQQVVLHRIGVRGDRLLGLPVEDDGRRVLYLAMDRPTQAVGSLRRMVAIDHREVLDARLVIRKGPLPIDVLAGISELADYVEKICPGVGMVVVDSLKDVAGGRSLSKDDVGGGLNSAIQEVLARGVEVVILHHQRKAQNGGDRMHTLDDVFGSTLITSGLGSVLALNGKPGEQVMELVHLKQPVEEVSLRIRHEHATGTTTLYAGELDVAEFVMNFGSGGVTVRDWALERHGGDDNKHLASAKRDLKKLEGDNASFFKIPGGPTPGGRTPDRWMYRQIGGAA